MVDSTNNLLCFLHRWGYLHCSDLNGSNIRTLYTSQTDISRGDLEIDKVNNQIYWVDSADSILRSIDLKGNNFNKVTIPNLSPKDIFLTNNYLYYLGKTSFLYRSLKNGSSSINIPIKSNDYQCIRNKIVGGWDFVNNDSDPMDDYGHGTHVASIAAGNSVLKGIAPDAELYVFKVLDSRGGSFENIMAAIERSADPNQDGSFSDHLDVISLSLGAICFGYDKKCGPDDPMSQAIDNVADIGVVSVIAAGNEGPRSSTISSPGAARKAITVGATYKKNYGGIYWEDYNPRVDQITSFSSRGPVSWTDSNGNENYLLKPDIVAPGAIICAAQFQQIFSNRQCLYHTYITMSGTSMATPVVSGAVALILQAHPDWSPSQIKEAIMKTAINFGYDKYTQGAGRIDVLAAVNYYPLTCGELSQDGNPFDNGDLTSLVGIVLLNQSKPLQWRNGDMNGDGKLDNTDVKIMSDYMSLITTVKPTCQPIMYCGTTPKDICVNYKVCDGTNFVSDCRVCGCASGNSCQKVAGYFKCAAPSNVVRDINPAE